MRNTSTWVDTWLRLTVPAVQCGYGHGGLAATAMDDKAFSAAQRHAILLPVRYCSLVYFRHTVNASAQLYLGVVYEKGLAYLKMKPRSYSDIKKPNRSDRMRRLDFYKRRTKGERQCFLSLQAKKSSFFNFFCP